MKQFIFSGMIIVAVMFSGLAGCTTVVRTTPPPARVEVRPAPPFKHAVWIDGHWKHRHGDWVWVPGHWVKRPNPGAHWVPGHWKQAPRGWKWVPGHWR
jgi:hypothetical protein